jgi:hypothetical protein
MIRSGDSWDSAALVDLGSLDDVEARASGRGGRHVLCPVTIKPRGSKVEYDSSQRVDLAELIWQSRFGRVETIFGHCARTNIGHLFLRLRG